MNKILGVLVLVFCVNFAYAPDSQKTEKIKRPPELTPEQQEVWKEELSYFRYLNAKDLMGFMSLWNPNFVGWPDYSDHPIRRADMEAIMAEEFRKRESPDRLVLPTPEAVSVFGHTAITYYLWPEPENSHVIYRVMHTWSKGPKGWQIIGGMDCLIKARGSGFNN